MTTIEHLIEQMKDALFDCQFIDNTWQQAERERAELQQRLESFISLCYHTGYCDAMQDVAKAMKDTGKNALTEMYKERVK